MPAGGVASPARSPWCAPNRPLINPGAEHPNLFRAQRGTFFRHPRQILFGPRDGVDQEALLALARDQGWTRFSPRKRRGSFIQAQTRLLFLFTVTFEALLLEEGLDIPLKAHFALQGWRQFAQIDCGLSER